MPGFIPCSSGRLPVMTRQRQMPGKRIRNKEQEVKETVFGIRSVQIVPNVGFLLNGKVRKFQGVCLHHDLGCLGAAFSACAARRQLEIMKDMGVNALRTSQLFNTPNLSRSAYVAEVDKDKCVACGRCVEFCPAGAVKLGQKLCKKDGTEVQYPKHELPSDATHEWSEADWDWDYRDNNRIEAYRTGTAPCKTACPAHIAIQGYLKMAAEGRYTEALALIKKNNPLPAVCGHICNRRCEDACTRGTIDEAIAIDEA